MLVHRDVYVCITCVDYDDFLALTLPSALSIFPNTWVVTAARDDGSLSVSRRHCARTFTTDVWWYNGARFDKAAAINEWIETSIADKAPCWILLLDADIYLPPGLEAYLCGLQRHVLYSAQRRMCPSKEDWSQFVDGHLSLQDFSISHVPIKNGKAFGSRPTSNPAGLQGYFQLFFLNESAAKRRRLFTPSGSARAYDVEFALTYPEQDRRDLAGYEVVHLGEPKVNWNGRVTQRWDSEALPAAPAADR